MLNKFFTTVMVAIVLVQCGTENTVKETKRKAKPYKKSVLAEQYNPGLKPFYFGVASGDPTSTSVILWTKVTPQMDENTEVWYELSADSTFSKIIKAEKITATSASDYVVKTDVTGLSPDTYYYYRFKALGKYSITGRTHTLPENDKDINLIFASCSNFAWGYFHAYDAMSRDTVDAIVHLGDYIYEYEKGTYASKKLVRDHIPGHELITLNDYRTRYAQYRLDPGLIRAHQMHPFITIWDDHEIANNTYKDGAQNHQPEDGDWNRRKKAAIQAYYEWLPVRESDPWHLYRAFDFGKRVKLVMIDNRIAGRTVQVSSPTDSAYYDVTRSMLGNEQFNWSIKELSSDQTWQVVGNPVLFGELKIPGWGNNNFYMDGWDGYPAEKHRWIDTLVRRKIDNMILVTGDFHSSLALQAGYTLSTGKYVYPWSEFVVPSISSGNYDEENPMEMVLQEEKKYKKLNKNLQFVNLHDHGYVRVTFTSDEAIARFIYVSSVTDDVYTRVAGPVFRVKKQ